jgi:hypothetical protein
MMSNEQLLEQIDGFLQELNTIFDRTFLEGQGDLGWERLERLKRRLSRFLAEEVSEEEALAFQLPLDDSPFTDLGDDIERCKNRLVALAEELRLHPEARTMRTAASAMAGEGKVKSTSDVSWDVFICHASEDKEPFVRRLAERLRAEGLKVWYDEFTLTMGDSLRRSIDSGLVSSGYGLVVLSHHSLTKDWPQHEIDGLMALEVAGRKVILPVWHNIDADEVRRRCPTLAGRVAAKSSDGTEAVVKALLRAIR